MFYTQFAHEIDAQLHRNLQFESKVIRIQSDFSGQEERKYLRI
jgi:hypothetical protein